jgi:hypothetical protein
MATRTQPAVKDSVFAADTNVVLVREAGVPFQPPLANVDPIAEWISLMEVVQMLCPVWPVRDKPMLGKEWRL